MATLSWEYDYPEVSEDGPPSFADLELSGDFFNNVFFFANVFAYLVFCSFLAAFAFPYGAFNPTRDACVEGAYVELFYATQLG